MKRLILFVCICTLLVACKNGGKSNSCCNTDDCVVENAENKLECQGVYKGTLPAADCPGIETTLTLNEDNTFTLNSIYLEKDLTSDEKGTYTIDGDLLTTQNNEGEISYYRIGEKTLRKLDMEKNEISGELAEYYILKKEEQEN